jgi:hypothetical protein
MFILLIDVDDDTRSVVFNDLSLHDTTVEVNGKKQCSLRRQRQGGGVEVCTTANGDYHVVYHAHGHVQERKQP